MEKAWRFRESFLAFGEFLHTRKGTRRRVWASQQRLSLPLSLSLSPGPFQMVSSGEFLGLPLGAFHFGN